MAVATGLLFGPTQGLRALPPAEPSAAFEPIHSDSLIVVLAPSNDVIWGYSDATGRWASAKLDARPGELVEPVIFGSVACVKAGTRAHAFSSITGSWDSVELGDDPRAEVWAASTTIVAARAGKTMHAFSARTGGWDTLDLGK